MCDLLQIDNTVQPTKESLKIAYKKAVMKHHPDRRGGDPKVFMKVKEAYESLKEHIEELNRPLQGEVIDSYNDYDNGGFTAYTTTPTVAGTATFTVSWG